MSYTFLSFIVPGMSLNHILFYWNALDVISLGKYNLYVIFLNKRGLQSACKYSFDVDTPLAKDLSCHFNLNFFCRKENTLTRLSPNLDDDLKHH